VKSKLRRMVHAWRKSLFARRVGGVEVGGADVKQDAPAHVCGVAQGNNPGCITGRQPGLHRKGDRLVATARRSTGINALAHNSIVPGAPRITPP
jgi:hypothetical protein